MTDEPAVTIVPNPHAPDVFADYAASFSMGAGVVKITLTAIRPLEVGGKNAHVSIGQLVMPVEGAQALAIGLYDFLKSRKVIPSGEAQ